MRESAEDSKEIIETLIANSKSFNEKTEFSQEKYIKKKEKKYFDSIQVRKPTLRLITEIFYRQDPDKALGLRMDSLSQLISFSGVNSSGNYLIYESGTSGLVPAAFLNSMGSTGDAQVVHMHPGNFPQKQAIFALNLSDSHMNKCMSVNIYSVLRQFYQESNLTTSTDEACEESMRKRKLESDETLNEETPLKKQHLNDNGAKNTSENISKKEKRETKENDKQKWQLENDEAIEVLKQKVDSLTIVSKEDPLSIVNELLPFVHPGRPVVMFHTCKEVLMEVFSSLKSKNSLINLRLTTNFMRNYQVLPMRTHPAVQIQGSSGWLLVGYTVKSTNVQ